MRLSFVGLCANRRQPILPGARLFELRRQTKQGCLVAERAANIMPSGRPAAFHASGTDIAGWPDMLNMAVAGM